MNKIFKGSVAGAAGIALLMGNYGTFALWSDSATVSDTTVSAGALAIASAGTPSWSYVAVDGQGATTYPAFDPAEDELVPGDTVRMVQPLDVEASGANLQATLEVTGLTESFANLDVTLSYAGKEATRSADGTGDWNLAFTTATDITALDTAEQATLTFSFPSTATGTTDQGATATLANAALLLSQVR